MRRVLAVAVCVLAACAPPSGECGGSNCAANQRCDWNDGRCVDDRAPTLVVTAPLDASVLTASTLTLSGVASDDDGVPKVEYSFDGATWTAVKVADDGAFVEPMTLPPVDGAPLRLTVRATDVRGQVTTKVVGLSVDDVAPSCARMSPDDGQLFTHGTVAVRYAAAGYRTLEFTFDGASVTPDVAAGEVSFSWPVPIEDWVVHKLLLVVGDAAGNTCKLESTFIVDDVPPVLSFESPFDGQVFGTNDFGIAFANGPATDGSGVVDVFVDVDDGMGPVQSGVWGDHWIVGRDTPVGEDYVPHYARAIGVDLAGNSTGIDVTWFADVVPPRLTITSPSPGQVLGLSDLQGDDVAISWTVADGDPQLVVTSPQVPGETFVAPTNELLFLAPPTEDAAQFTVQLTASTRTGSVSGSVLFMVNRGSPFVVNISPPPGRMMSPPIVVTFSETIIASPNPYGSWNDAGTVFTLDSRLFWDNPFFFTPLDATDRTGNPVVSSPNGLYPAYASGRTRPAYWPGDAGLDPDAGLIDAPGSTFLWAAADSESALNFAVDGEWYGVNGYTGIVELRSTLPTMRAPGSAYAYLRPDAGIGDARVSGLSASFPPYFSSEVWLDEYPQPSGFTSYWLIPSTALPEEPAQSEYYAFLTSGQFAGSALGYTRNQNSVAPFNSVTGLATSRSHWTFTEGSAAGRWTAFGCDAGVCDFLEIGNFPDGSDAGFDSFSAGAFCDVHAFASSAADAGLVMETVPWTAGGCPSTGCPVTSTTPVSGTTAAVVFDPRDEITFELISSTGATFDISTGTLDSACNPTLTHVSSFTVPQGLVSAQPVWMYGKPSALYLDGNGTVRLYVSP